jgi:hypothetical protein
MTALQQRLGRLYLSMKSRLCLLLHATLRVGQKAVDLNNSELFPVTPLLMIPFSISFLDPLLYHSSFHTQLKSYLPCLPRQ